MGAKLSSFRCIGDSADLEQPFSAKKYKPPATKRWRASSSSSSYEITASAVDENETLGDLEKLNIASRRGFFGIVQRLVSEGIDVNAKFAGSKFSALQIAIENRHENIAEYLIRNGADVNIVSSNGWPLLALLMRHAGGPSFTQLLIENGADVNEEAVNGLRPLDIAGELCDIATVEVLLRNGAKLDEMKCGFSPLQNAAQKGRADLIRLLLAYAADVDRCDPDRGWSPLMFAAELDHELVVTLLLNAGANINNVSADGRTALHLACQNGCMNVVKLLIAHPDYSPTMKDHSGLTAEEIAFQNGWNEIARLLQLKN